MFIKRFAKNVLTSGTSLSTRFIVMTVLILLITMSISVYLNVQNQKNHFLTELENRGRSLGSFIALTSSDAVLGQDFMLMNLYMEEISKQPDVLYGVIVTPAGDNLTSYLNYESKLIDLSKVDQWKNSNFLDVIKYINSSSDTVSMKFPIGEPASAFLILGLSTKNITALTNEALTQQLLEIFLIIVFLIFCIYLLFRINVSHPIAELIKSIRHISAGNLDHQARALSNDELGSVVNSFNAMTLALKKSYGEKDAVVKELQNTNIELQAATHSKSIFLANMSHEIRTPLTAIIGFGQYLKKPDIKDIEKRKAINAIIENAGLLQNIINDILDLSKIEAGKMILEKTVFSVFEVIEEIESLIRLQCDNKSLSFSIHYEFPLPATIKSDTLRFKQVLINLLSNAVKFTEQGSITLTVSYAHEFNKMVFAVKDTGIGLSAEKQQHIFEEFTQADETTTRQFGGTGLGLAISLNLAKALGGNISVKSAEDIGSKFTFTMSPGDIKQESLINKIPDKSISEPEHPLYISTQQLAGNILIAEDNEHTQQLLSLYLSSPAINLDIVDNGKKAVDHALKYCYDLILMDMQMPVMDGLKAVEELRSRCYTQPIVALTANAMLDDQTKCIDAGCDEFLSKPINEHKLSMVLTKYLKKTSNSDLLEETKTQALDEKVKVITDNFLKNLPATIESLLQSYRNNDWDHVKSQLHSLKGTSGNLGIFEIMDIASELETKIREQQCLELVDLERFTPYLQRH